MDVELADKQFGPPGERQARWPWATYLARPHGYPDTTPETAQWRRDPAERGSWHAGIRYHGSGACSRALAAALEAIQAR